MPRLTRIATLVLLPALLSFAFIACGDDDDDGGAITRDNSSNSSDTNSNNGNSTTSGNSSGNNDDKSTDIRPGGSDEEYVSDICKGFRDYLDELQTAMAGIDFTNPDYEKEFNEKLIDPMRAVAETFENANPPSDLKEWHSQFVSSVNQIVDQLEEGNLDALGDESLEVPEMPADAQERLEKIAENNEDCKAIAEDGMGVFEDVPVD